MLTPRRILDALLGREVDLCEAPRPGTDAARLPVRPGPPANATRSAPEELHRLSFGYLHDALPASWRPRDGTERLAFVRCAPAVRFAYRRCGTDFVRPVVLRVDSSDGRT